MSEDRACVYIVDDDPGMQRVLQLLVNSIGLDCEVYDRPRAFIDSCSRARSRGEPGAPPGTVPGCVVADVIMPEMTGIELISAARAKGIGLPFIILTGHADVEVAVSAFRSGAFDFLEKPFSDSTYLALVQKAIAVSRKALESTSAQKRIEERIAVLTRREREVVAELIGGDSNKQIARKLNLSPRTVERHRQNALKRLGVRSILELGTVTLPAMSDS